jgi:hypothetical protein
MRSSLCERRLKRTALRPALLTVKTAQFTHFFPSGMTSHSNIAQFNWECIGRFRPLFFSGHNFVFIDNRTLWLFLNFPHYERTYGLFRRTEQQLASPIIFLYFPQTLLGGINKHRLFLHFWYNCIHVANWGTLKDDFMITILAITIWHPKICFQ